MLIPLAATSPLQTNPLLQLTSLLLVTGDDGYSASSGWVEEERTWWLLAQLPLLQRLQVPSMDACPADCTLPKVRPASVLAAGHPSMAPSQLRAAT